ncbi:MAG TPA: branched-chain amino acid ABC transporter permease [Solirubrobacteraceae bacterium]|nr:branched-chain amino acid ABC transporter permease [Solirubrobacteraceae bacterium]
MTQFVQTIVLGLLIGGTYALLASGLTLIFGVMRVINIAHGAFLILAAFVTYSIWRATGLDPLVSVLFTTPLMFAFGWMLYVTAVRRVRGAHVSSSVLLTFALALVVEGLMGVIWGNTSHSVRPPYVNDSFTIGEIFLPKAQVYGCALAVVVLGALYLLLTRTWLGRAIRASAVNPSGAALVGVNVSAVAALAFAVGVAAAGAGGSIVSVLYPFLPGSHYQWIARLLGIIVLGGMGSLPGAVLGALLLGVAETATVTYISPAWATAVPYVVIFVVLLVRPQGLMGARLREDVATA